MLSIATCYGLFVVLSLVVAYFAGRRQGLPQVLGIGMAMSMLAASWFELTIAGLPIDVFNSVAVVLLLAYSAKYWRNLLWPVTTLDFLLFGLWLWHIIVDVSYGESVGPTAAAAYGEWVLPYAAGRFAFAHRGQFVRLAPWLASVACVLSIFAIFESFTSFNPWQSWLHEIDDKVDRPSTQRYDLLYRAIATTRHPIFLGVVLMLLSVWSVVMIDSTSSGKVKAFGYSALLVTILGICATVSRGPVLGMMLALTLFITIQFRPLRWALATLLVVSAIAFVTNFDRALSLLESFESKGSKTIVEVDEELEVYSGTRNRVFVARVYGPIIWRGGALGFGTENTDQFPVSVPGLPTDARSANRLRIVDNTYVLIGLRFGMVGLVLFALLMVASVVTLFAMRRTSATFLYPAGPASVTAYGCVLISVALEITTVYSDYDFMAPLLFHFGAVAGTRLSIRDSAEL